MRLLYKLTRYLVQFDDGVSAEIEAADAAYAMTLACMIFRREPTEIRCCWSP